VRAVDDIWPAAVVLVAVAKKLRQQLPESALAVEVDAVIARTERAIDEHEQRALQDARTRAQIRELSRQVRS
jgi:hypothetical protein